MQFRLVFLCCALLASLPAVGMAGSQPLKSDEEAHEIVRQGSFEGGWRLYSRSLVVSFRMDDIRLYTDDPVRPTTWGLLMPRDFPAVLKVTFQDSKGKPLRVNNKKVAPVYLYNEPFTLLEGSTVWSTVLPNELFNPRAQLCIGAVVPIHFLRSNHCAIIPIREAVVIPADGSIAP